MAHVALDFALTRETNEANEIDGVERVCVSFTIRMGAEPVMFDKAGKLVPQVVENDAAGRPLPSDRFGPRVLHCLAVPERIRKHCARSMSRHLARVLTAAQANEVTIAGKEVKLPRVPKFIGDTDASGVKLRDEVYAAVKAAMPAEVTAAAAGGSNG